MLHFLGFILIIILAIVFIGIAILLSVVRGVFGFGRGKNTTAYQRTGGAERTGAERARRTAVSDDGTVTVEEGELHINRKKIFGKDEGEYVPYEEVRD